MRAILCLLYIFLALPAVALAGNGKGNPEPGRYQIVIAPNSYYAYLLDTATGRVWKRISFTDVKGEPTVWEYMDRLDNFGALMEFVRETGLKTTPDKGVQPIMPPSLAHHTSGSHGPAE